MSTQKNKNLLIITKIIIIIGILSLVIFLVIKRLEITRSLVKNENQPPVTSSTNTTASTSPVIISTASSSDFSLPISEALTRVTKKPFGLYVSPKNSPVKPEHFTGYHTGVDFETNSEEQAIDVPIYAICSGPLKLKKLATGYGGVAVQECTINKEAVTVIYGHLRLKSIIILPGSFLNQGQQIGFLGQSYSTETAGERKHLHLGIHKGKEISLLGYVSDKSALSQWIDFLSLIK